MHFYLFLKVESLLLLSQALRLPYKERFWEYCLTSLVFFIGGGFTLVLVTQIWEELGRTE